MLDPNDHVLDYVDAYLHEALSEEEEAQLERHCQGCKICQVALEEARGRVEALQALPPVEASDELIRTTWQRIAAAPRFRPTVNQVVWSLLGAAAVIIAAVNVYYATLSPSPYDLQLLGQTEWLSGSDASLRVVLLDHRTRRPLAGVPVEIHLVGPDQGTVQLADFTTDRFGSGTPRMTLPDWEDGRYRLQVRAQTPAAPEVVTQQVRLRRSWQLMLSSDKPVYQPGQTIQVRSLALRRPGLRPIAGEDAVFSVTDPKGNVIFRLPEPTSEHGIASMECPLAREIIQGPYQIECRLGDTVQSLTVQVQKYVLPKFKIGVELDRPYYQPGEVVRGTVQVDYFFGKPAADATVRIDVRSTEPWASIVHQETLRTDADGTAEFQYPLPESLVGRPQLGGDAEITVLASVRDTAGQKQSRSVSRIVTARPIQLEVIPESGTLVPGVANTIYFFTSYPDGRPARTRIAVSGLRQELNTGSLGVASLDFTAPADGSAVRWSVRATDDEGRTSRGDVVLEPGQPGDFLVRTDRAVYDGGQTMHVVAMGGGVEPVFLDLIRDGQTVLTEVVEMSDGRGQHQLDLPPELFGTIELCAYRYGVEGLPVRKSRVVYVRQAGSLKIETTLDRKEYRPGQQARLDFRLTDQQGQPVPGALSLAAVDEAVFSVLAQRPGLQQAFFTLEQELLEPIYAIYAWSPELTTGLPTDDQIRFEQALFSRTVQQEQTGAGFSRELHTLSLTSFPAKTLQTERAKQAGLEKVAVAWAVLAVVVTITCIVLLCEVFRPANVFSVLLFAVVAVVITALFIPAMQSARESARRAPGRAGRDLAALDAKSEDARPAERLPTDELPPDSQAAAPPRVRRWFPETLLWRPELITDERGRASIEVDLADSITTWRLTASAVSAQGKLGGSREAIRVFQPFFVDLDLPVALTRGDEVAVPVVVYNYLDGPQTVELTLAQAEWFELLDGPVQKIDLRPGEVRSISYRLRAAKVGRHELTVDARGSELADAIQRQIEVVPDGRRVEQVFNGTLEQPLQIECSVPQDAIEGSVQAVVKIYPSSFSQLIEGLDAIFQRPYGCFEQTSSTTYPNVLALDYLRRTGKRVPDVETKARQYIHLGYQRLLGFEVAGGGFDWFGGPPAKQALTAYGLMEFTDMARVHDVEVDLIRRTRRWLLEQQEADGSWQPQDRPMHDEPTRRGGDMARLSTTAYIAWAVFTDQAESLQSRATLDFLLRHEPASIEDPYLVALVCNAVAVIDTSGRAAGPYLDRLDSMKQTSPDRKLFWWDQSQGGRTTFYGAGRSGSIETTALAAMAMIQDGTHPASARGALAWLVRQKDPAGTWHSTQATVLALKALLAGTGSPLGGGQQRRIEIAVDDQAIREIAIPPDQDDVMRQVSLSGQLAQGTHRLSVSEKSDTAAGYQVTFSYYLPEEDVARGQQEPLSIDVAYDRTELKVNDTVTATATVLNNLPAAAPMVILDLPIPAGFAVEPDDLARAVESEMISKYQLTARSVVVYLRQLAPGKELQLRYRLRATMPVKVTAPAAEAYHYYDPDTRVVGSTGELTVLATQ